MINLWSQRTTTVSAQSDS